MSCIARSLKFLVGGGVVADEEGGHSKKMYIRNIGDMAREMDKIQRGNNNTLVYRSFAMAKAVDHEEALQGRKGGEVLMRRGGTIDSRKKRQARKVSGGGSAQAPKKANGRIKNKIPVRRKERMVSN